ncbi:SdrD B-like domain-containing protein [Runella aurantiaca]|uniref:SdrD B-like domain-containing protein n=1 Tax=Runella aurantiaca TaxID=2282308 RepID=UPI001313E3BF|nr:SdrD B-like domain-containing protein [Runella aurantiaca]
MKTSVSGCYQSNGSKATVSVEVAWSNAPSGDNIVVTYGAQSRTIIPGPYTTSGGNGTIVSPQVVAFEVDANGATGQTITANFVTNTGCSATSTAFSLPSACLPLTCTGNELGGTVFYDYNADGQKDAGESLGLPNVVVKAFDCDGNLVGTTTTDAYGKYVFTAISAANYPLRVEFSSLPALYGQGTMNGADGRTTTQFINAPDCNVDLGVLNPVDYCESNPMLSIPCYVYGDPLPAGSVSGTRDAVVGFDYNLSGLTNMAAMTHIATASQVGTVWGEAYNKSTQKLFMSATLKRHSGLGPLGLGGIYVTDWADPINPITTSWLSVTSLTVSGVPINVGSVPVNGAGGRGLSTDPTQPSRDSIAFTQAAKIGIGGIALSDDGNTLFFTNLFDAKLYKVDMTTYNTSGTNPTTATSIDVFGSTSCPGGTIRPWATKFYKGDVYVGAVCDAQTSGNKSDLRAFVYKVNPTTGTSTVVFDFPLTYPKGYANTNALNATGWYPWSDLWSDRFITAANEVVYPQPIFEDIEFDIDGTMILAFGDRNGVQTGYRNYMPTGTSTALYSGHVGGDILRAFYNQSGAYVLENNAKAGPNIGYGPDNNQGPGFGEYYNDNFQDDSDGTVFHAEIAMGGLAVRPGSGEVIAVTVDPLDVPLVITSYLPYLQAGGVRHYNNQTGQVNSAYIVYSSNLMSGLFGKSTGLGDIVLRCSLPEFIEIGNRVWVDTNKNGVQDPCEKALPGVTVSLYKGATLIATTTTNANGEYYFSSKSKLTTGTWSGTGADTTLLPTTQYSLVFGQSGSQYSAGTLTVSGNGKFAITTKDATVNNGNDQNDSDIAEINGFPTISVTTGDLASVNHTFDAGFYCIFPTSNNIQVSLPSCPPTLGTNTTDGKIQITAAVESADRFRIRSGTNWTGAADTSYATALLIGNTFPKDIQTGISSAGGSYIIRLYNGECCYRDTVITIQARTKPNAGTNQSICAPATTATLTAITLGGMWSTQSGNPAVATITNAGAVSGMTANGTYNFIYTLNGCTDTVSVVRNPQPIQVNLSPATICENQSLTYTDASGTNGTWSGPGVSDTGTGATVSAAAALTQLGQSAPVNFYIYYTQILGECSRIDSGLVSINPRPLVTITGPTLICGNQLPVSFTGSPAGGTFTLPQGLPAGAVTINSNVATLNPGFNITSLTFSYSYTDATTDCSNTDSHTITVTPAPNAGRDTTLACVDALTNTLATSTTLSPVTPGGTWSQIGTTPTTATVTGNNVTGMTMAGTYQFIYTLNDCSDTVSVTVVPCQGCVQPNAGPDQSICSPTTTATLTAITLGGTWTAQLGNPASATITNLGAVSGMTVDGTYRFIYSVTSGGQTCTDTVSVIRNPKPEAGPDQSICSPTTTATLTAITLGGTWSAQSGNPVAATITNAGTVTGMTANGTYNFIYMINGCTDTVSVVRTAKPDAGADQTLTCPPSGISPTTANVTGAPSGGVWSTLASNPAAATVTNAGAVSGMTVAGTYQFIYTLNDCSDTVQIQVPTCIAPVFDLALRKTLAVGQSASVVAGSTVTFTITVFNQGNVDATNIQVTDYIPAGLTLNDANWSVVGSTATLNTVIASLAAGASTTRDITFVVSTGVTGSITNLAEISSATGGVDVDSSPDSNPANDGTPKNDVINESGLTGGDEDDHDPEVITVTPAPVFDLALRKTLAVGQSANVVAGSTVTFTITVFNQGNVDATNIQVTDYIPAGLTLNDANWSVVGSTATLNTVIASLAAGASTTRDITFTVGTGVTGSLSNLAEISSATGGVDVDSSPDSNPANDGTPKNDVINENGLTGGDEDDHDPEVITVTSAQVDLSLKKMISTKIAELGDTLTYTIKVFNQSGTLATGVEVSDSLATSVQFITGSFTTTRGTATLSNNVIVWTIGSIGANGDTVTLTYKVKAISEGIHFNTAEISKTNEPDVDSTPGNGNNSEDDNDQECFTVPFKLCPIEKVQASVPAYLTNVQWYKDGGSTPIVSGNTVLLSEVGIYTFTASNQQCPAEGCCPIIIEPGDNCCPIQICIPFTINKKKK